MIMLKFTEKFLEYFVKYVPVKKLESINFYSIMILDVTVLACFCGFCNKGGNEIEGKK